MQDITRPPDHPPPPGPLTEREGEALRRVVVQGLGNQDITRKFNISDPIVRTHGSNVLGKLHLATRIWAALCALREALAPRDAGTPVITGDEESWRVTPTPFVDHAQQMLRSAAREAVFLLIPKSAPSR